MRFEKPDQRVAVVRLGLQMGKPEQGDALRAFDDLIDAQERRAGRPQRCLDVDVAPSTFNSASQRAGISIIGLQRVRPGDSEHALVVAPANA